MRTVILISGILIASALEKSDEPAPKGATTCLGVILLVAMAMDIGDYLAQFGR